MKDPVRALFISSEGLASNTTIGLCIEAGRTSLGAGACPTDDVDCRLVSYKLTGSLEEKLCAEEEV